MTLSAGRCFLVLNRMAPSHRVRIQNVQIIARYDLLERFTTTVIATEQVDFVTDQVGCVAAEAFRWTTEYLWLRPCQSLCIKHMQVLEVLIS